MKKLFALFLLIYSFNINAQITLKTNFANLFMNKADLSLSFELSDKFDIEFTGGMAFGQKTPKSIFDNATFKPKYRGSYFELTGKYFPKIKKFEGYYFGSYIKIADLTFKDSTVENNNEDYYKKFTALGITNGYEFILKEHFIIDISSGIGMFLNYESELYNPNLLTARPNQDAMNFNIKFTVGYRF